MLYYLFGLVTKQTWLTSEEQVLLVKHNA